MSENVYDNNCTPFTPPLLPEVLDYSAIKWVSTQSFTAVCPNGLYGQSVTITVTYYSNVSQADADANALAQATAQALAQLQCGYVGTATVGGKTVKYFSLISQADANANALVCAQQAQNCSNTPC